MQLLTFRHLQNIYCFRIADIAEVLPAADPVALPRSGPAFEGICQIRSRIITLLKSDYFLGGSVVNQETQIVLFAEPYFNLALRVPGPIETVFLMEKKILITDVSHDDGLLQAIIYDGEDAYHLLSTSKLFLRAKSLVVRSALPEASQGGQA